MNSYTIFVSHFGDLFWVRHTVERIRRLTPNRNLTIIVIDQSRASEPALMAIDGVDQVISFELDKRNLAILGHDHPSSLNKALREVDVSSSHVIVVDSDCFPVTSTWLERLEQTGEIALATDPAKYGLTHPCLMVFPTEISAVIDFEEGLYEVGLDTGRLVGLQVTRSGQRAHLIFPTAAFGGRRGHFFLEKSIYHHGSGSLSMSEISGPPRVRTEKIWRQLAASPRQDIRAFDLLRLMWSEKVDKLSPV